MSKQYLTSCTYYNGCFQEPSTSAPIPIPEECKNQELLENNKTLSSICSCPITANSFINSKNDIKIKTSYNDWCSDAQTAYNNDLKDWKNLKGRFNFLNDNNTNPDTGWWKQNYLNERMELKYCVIGTTSTETMTDYCNNDAKNHFNRDTDHGGYVYDGESGTHCSPSDPNNCCLWGSNFYVYRCKRTDQQAEYDLKNSRYYKQIEPTYPCTQVTIPTSNQEAVACCVNIIENIEDSKIENVKQECNQNIVQQIQTVLSNTTTPIPTTTSNPTPPSKPTIPPELNCKFLFKSNEMKTKCEINILHTILLSAGILSIFILIVIAILN